MSNVDLLKQGYKDFAAGNIKGVVSIWHPDIVWEACTGVPYITGNGIFKGAPAIIESVFAHVPTHFDNFKIEIREFIDAGDKVVVVGYYTGIWKATGKAFKANATHTWTFKNGKVANYFEAVDSAVVVNG